MLRARVPHVAVLALISIGFAGCSADMSTRLSQRFFFQSVCLATRSHRLRSPPRSSAANFRNIPARNRRANPRAPPNAAPQSYPTASNSCLGREARGNFLCSAEPNRLKPLAVPHHARSRRTTDRRHGGTTIIVGTSDTLDTLSRRYNVSLRRDPAGQRLQGTARPVAGPATDHSAADSQRQPPRRARPLPPRHATPSVHVVNRGDTVLSIARRNHVSMAELAKANNLDRSAKLKLGMKLTVPGAKTAAVTPPPRPGAGAQPATTLAVTRYQISGSDSETPGEEPGCRRRRRRPRSYLPKRRLRPPRQPARCRHSAGRCAAR